MWLLLTELCSHTLIIKISWKPRLNYFAMGMCIIKLFPKRLRPQPDYFPLDDRLQTGHVLDPEYQADVAMNEIVNMASDIATDSLV